jgi:hypothetical protein
MFRTRSSRAWRLVLMGPLVLLPGCGGSAGGHGSVALGAAKEAAKLKGLPAGHDPARKVDRRARKKPRAAAGKPVGKAIDR